MNLDGSFGFAPHEQININTEYIPELKILP